MLTTPSPSSGGKQADTDTPTSAALKCAYSLMQQRIISNPNDMMGVLLYGTQRTKFQDEEKDDGVLLYPNCYLVMDLDIPAAEDVKTLKALVNDEEEAEKLLNPAKGPISMASVLFAANQIFTTKAPNFLSRRLFLVTDNDDPHRSDKAIRASATVRAKDLYDLGVVIELFPISSPAHEFDRSRFYDVWSFVAVAGSDETLNNCRTSSTTRRHQIQKPKHLCQEPSHHRQKGMESLS